MHSLLHTVPYRYMARACEIFSEMHSNCSSSGVRVLTSVPSLDAFSDATSTGDGDETETSSRPSAEGPPPPATACGGPRRATSGRERAGD